MRKGSEPTVCDRNAWARLIHGATPRSLRHALRWRMIGVLAVAIVALGWAIGAGPSPAAAQTSPAEAWQRALVANEEAADDALDEARRGGATILVIPQEGGQVWDYGRLGAPDETIDGYARLAEGYVDDASMLDRTQTGVAEFRSKLREKLSLAPGLFAEIGRVLAEAAPKRISDGAGLGGQRTYFLWVAIVTVLGLGVGYFIERAIYAMRLVGPWFVAQQIPSPEGYVQKLPILALRVALTAGGVAISAAISLAIVLVAYEPHGPTQKTAIVIVATYVAMRMVHAVWRMILAPYLPNYRLPQMNDADARRLYLWLFVVAAFAILSIGLGVWLESIGLSSDHYALISASLALVTVLLNLAMIRINHRTITNAFLSTDDDRDPSILTMAAMRLWAPLASLYFIVAWAEMTYRLIMDIPIGTPLIAGAYTILLVLLIVYAAVNYVIEWVFQRRRMIRALNARHEQRVVEADGPDLDSDDDEGGIIVREAPPPAAFRGYRMRSMEELSRRVASVLALIAGVWSMLWIWNAETTMDDGGMVSRLLDVAWVAFLGYVAYSAVRIAIDQKIAEEGGADVSVEPGDEGGGAAAASRLATLLPLFRNFLLVTIAIVTTLMVLLETGVNVTPIFAGAGVVGLAIGFGAQTLVRDIFSGMFFLIDDAFRKGEYIDIGAVKGTVEKISIRSFQLRHHLGMLHTIPFGEIQHLTNYSRDWVMMKLPLRLTYDTDVEKVRKLIKNLGKELQQDPLIGEKFLQPLKSQGVYEMEESAMILRVKFMTKPGEQWVIRKRVYAEIRELFEREGIKFAHREVTVHVADGGRDMSEDEKRAVAGAVRPILDPPEGARALALQDDR